MEVVAAIHVSHRLYTANTKQLEEAEVILIAQSPFVAPHC